MAKKNIKKRQQPIAAQLEEIRRSMRLMHEDIVARIEASRKRITGEVEEVAAPSQEPWIPKVGDVVVVVVPPNNREPGTLGSEVDFGDNPLRVLKVYPNQDKDIGIALHERNGSYTSTLTRYCRPATPEEIARYNQEQEAARLKREEEAKPIEFWTRVKSVRGPKMFRTACYKPDAQGDYRCIADDDTHVYLHRSEFTVA